MFHSIIPENDFYVVSDLHINHANYCRGTSNWTNKDSCRDFTSLEEMNKVVLDSIINTVPENAYLFIIGDILFGDKTKLPEIINYLRPRKQIYLAGNHCDFIRKNQDYINLFDWFGDYLEVFVKKNTGGKKLVCMFHYPVKVWRDCDRSYMLSGHSHNNLPYTEDEPGLDVGWDGWKRPLSFSEIDAILKSRRWKSKDHH